MSGIISSFSNNTTVYHSDIGLADNKGLCIWSMATLLIVAVLSLIYGLWYIYVLCARQRRYSRMPLIAV